MAGRCLVQPLPQPLQTHPLVLQRDCPCPRSLRRHPSWDVMTTGRERSSSVSRANSSSTCRADSGGWFDAKSQLRASPAQVSPTPLGSCRCWASVTTDLCRGLQKPCPSMWPPDPLVACLWEESNPRASEGTLPPMGPSTLKRMLVDAQSVGTALRTCWRKLRRPSPNISIASDAESDILTFRLLTYLVNRASSSCMGSVWTGVCDVGLQRGGPLSPVSSGPGQSKEDRGGSRCYRPLNRIHLSFTFLGSRT